MDSEQNIDLGWHGFESKIDWREIEKLFSKKEKQDIIDCEFESVDDYLTLQEMLFAEEGYIRDGYLTPYGYNTLGNFVCYLFTRYGIECIAVPTPQLIRKLKTELADYVQYEKKQSVKCD